MDVTGDLNGDVNGGVSIDLRADHLDCGTELATLVEQVADGAGTTLTAHQRSCPYCRAALTELLLR